MGPGTFKQAIYELSNYFDRKFPRDETFNLWAEEVKGIPEHHAPKIIAAMKKLEWPRNLPALMCALSIEIAENCGENKEYEIHDRRIHPWRWANKDCPLCKGEGTVRTPMDWPVAKTAEGQIITKRINPPVLCTCTDKWEMGG